jgi:hypothetical protein
MSIREREAMNIHSRRSRAAMLAAAVIGVLMIVTQMDVYAASGGGGHKPAPFQFGTPVRLPTFESCGGYEPGIALDKFGNIYVTAHKQNHCDAVADDPQAPAGVRAQSWLWTSTDGVNFKDMPGLANLPADPGSLDVGDEGDIALDDAGHFYFVDTKIADDSFSRWTVTGAGTKKMTQDIHRPVVPTLVPVDDRPWVVAHGANTVLYAGNVGDKDTYNMGSVAAGCTGTGILPPQPGQYQQPPGGRYSVFLSHDAGATFDPVGCTLPDSGWCRPAADHTAGSLYLYMVCTDDARADDEVNTSGDPGFTAGTLYSYVSANDGATWTRYRIGSYNSDLPGGGETNDIGWPQVVVAKDGSLYALFNDPVTGTDSTGAKIKVDSRLHLYHSTTHGRTWTMQDVTPANEGLIRYSWVDIAPDGKTIGVGYETHATLDGNWHVYAGKSPGFGSAVNYVLVDPVETAPPGDFNFGDFFEVGFDNLGRLDVVYTRCTDLVPGDDTTDCLNSDVMFARSN